MSEELEALQAEAERDDNAPVRVMLKTVNGEAAIYVPPFQKWRSQAKRALFQQLDDYTWAEQTLNAEDFEAWVELNPDGDELAEFITAWTKATGTDPKRSSGSGDSLRGTRKR